MTREAPTDPCLTAGIRIPLRDVAPKMPWSGPLPTPKIEHAFQKGTSEMHRTNIVLAASALTTNRSMNLGDRSYERGSNGRTVLISWITQTALLPPTSCVIGPLDGDDPFAEVPRLGM